LRAGREREGVLRVDEGSLSRAGEQDVGLMMMMTMMMMI